VPIHRADTGITRKEEETDVRRKAWWAMERLAALARATDAEDIIIMVWIVDC